jgi:hypothetical protein
MLLLEACTSGTCPLSSITTSRQTWSSTSTGGGVGGWVGWGLLMGGDVGGGCAVFLVGSGIAGTRHGCRSHRLLRICTAASLHTASCCFLPHTLKISCSPTTISPFFCGRTGKVLQKSNACTLGCMCDAAPFPARRCAPAAAGTGGSCPLGWGWGRSRADIPHSLCKPSLQFLPISIPWHSSLPARAQSPHLPQPRSHLRPALLLLRWPVRRVGRTGRLASDGHAFSFFTREMARMAPAVIDLLQQHSQVRQVPASLAGHAVASQPAASSPPSTLRLLMHAPFVCFVSIRATDQATCVLCFAVLCLWLHAGN